jgi:hypothetical protein
MASGTLVASTDNAGTNYDTVLSARRDSAGLSSI